MPESQSNRSFTHEEVLRALYISALGREADAKGLQGFKDLLARDPGRLYEIARLFHDSSEHKSVMGKPPGIADHSQFGEFPLLLKHLVRTGQKHGIIVDVGARGRDRSNSFDLMTDFGWRGLLIEANPALVEPITQEFAGLNFELVSCAIGTDEGRQSFFIGTNDDVSSLLEGAAKAWGEVRGRHEVQVRRLGPILEERAIPADFDILSLDIEGMDIVVLNDLLATTAYRPGIIVIEASNDFAVKSLDDIPVSRDVKDGYQISYQTAPNLILTRRT